ncbi:terminase large subunit [Gordonia phage Ruthy]|uniref:Terminase large subunit n=1 Tax=Gordonia phage Ruthy TaxID=2250323 RepID=A0A345L5B3_9CAUD|nr:terminase large subunit [Gordonia phage Ruthy]AXH50465.1 terminase large subunit [Gordonia phage Ruthy]
MVSTISEEFPTLTGRQDPHHLSVFAGDTSHGEKAIELKRRIGVSSMPWQRDAQYAICSMTPEGRWTHPTCCLICTRQNGKSEILIDRCLYGLFKLDETILYTAQRWKTVRDAWRRMMKLIKRRAWLRKHVVKATCSQGEGIIELDSGALIAFGTRSADAGRGLTVIDLIVYDEAYNLTESETSAMAFTQLAAQNPQRIYASSAVNQDQHPNGVVLSAVRKRGLSREPRLYFAEWMAPCDVECCEMCALAGVMDRDDLETLEYANPSFGVIQTEEKINDIKADLSTEAGRKAFDVEALGRGDWPEPDVERIHHIDMSRWGDLKDRTPEFVAPPVIGLSLAPDRRHWAVTAAQRTVDGVHIEVGKWQAFTHAELLRFVAAVVTDWDPGAVMVDGRSLAKVIVPKLAEIGIEAEELNTPQMAAACGGVLDDIDDGTLTHSGQPELDLAADVVQLRDLPQGDFVFACDLESAPLVSAACAYAGALRHSKPRTAPASPVSAGAAAREDTSDQYSGDLDVLAAAF